MHWRRRMDKHPTSCATAQPFPPSTDLRVLGVDVHQAGQNIDARVPQVVLPAQVAQGSR